MKFPFLLFAILPLLSKAQLLTPSWRGEPESSYSEWNIFAFPYLEPNHPDVSGGTATIIGTTPGAFITSSGNIYSFQSATSFQLEHMAEEATTNVFLQIKALGSSIDLTNASLIASNSEGERFSEKATRTMIVSEEELGGERGGTGRLYTLQWDLRSTPISGTYFILFKASESSLSLDRVSLDTSLLYKFVPRPRPLDIKISENEVHLSWPGGGHLQSSSSITSGWTDLPESFGRNSLTLPLESSTGFFRIKQTSATE